MKIIITTAPQFRHYASRARAMLRFLECLAPKNSSLEVYLVGNYVMKKNVLSYEAPKHFSRPDVLGTPLGEIYLNPSYIASRGENFDLMLVHGLLHLLGYDHARVRDRMKMEKKEDALLRTYLKHISKPRS